MPLSLLSLLSQARRSTSQTCFSCRRYGVAFLRTDEIFKDHIEGWVWKRDQEDRATLASRVPAHRCSCHHSASGCFTCFSPLWFVIILVEKWLFLANVCPLYNFGVPIFSWSQWYSLFSATGNLRSTSCRQKTFPCWEPPPWVEHTGGQPLFYQFFLSFIFCLARTSMPLQDTSVSSRIPSSQSLSLTFMCLSSWPPLISCLSG